MLPERKVQIDNYMEMSELCFFILFILASCNLSIQARRGERTDANKQDYSLHERDVAEAVLVGGMEHTRSKADFINKMNVALKEAAETEYWLMLLKDSEYIDEKTFTSIQSIRIATNSSVY